MYQQKSFKYCVDFFSSFKGPSYISIVTFWSFVESTTVFINLLQIFFSPTFKIQLLNSRASSWYSESVRFFLVMVFSIKRTSTIHHRKFKAMALYFLFISFASNACFMFSFHVLLLWLDKVEKIEIGEREAQKREHPSPWIEFEFHIFFIAPAAYMKKKLNKMDIK